MKRSRCAIFSFLSVLVIGLTVSRTAWSYSDSQVHDMVQSRLINRRPSDTPGWWNGLGDNAVSVIIGMYGAETNTFHRIRLLQGLGWMDNQQAVDFVQEQTERTDLDVLRNAGIRALARGHGAKEVDFISKFLKNDDPQTRLAAAQSLKDLSGRSPRAKEIYDAYLKEEKTPWLVDKLNGNLGINGQLKPVSSSEDRISPQFEGTWKGYWIAPKPSSKGMQSASILLELETPDDSKSMNAVSGTLSVLSHGKISRSFNLGDGSGRGVHLTGNFLEISQPSKAGSMKLSFKGDLTRVGDALLLEVQVPEKSSVLVLKKD